MTPQEQAVSDLAYKLHQVIAHEEMGVVIPALTLCLSYALNVANIHPDNITACLNSAYIGVNKEMMQ
jgi:hypothetical protein